MAQRTVAFYDGEYIGIESIFTVINGKQINIADKVEKLRALGRAGKLLCSCGCGAKLTVVAGERCLKEQHFRLQEGENEVECHLITEGKTSIDSKIVLKCWLEDKLKVDDIESRVPINLIEDTKRKYEFTLLSQSRKIAISYYHDKVNLSDEKLDILDSNSKNINLIYIVDIMNGGVLYQYPESLMKIQVRQGYGLYLDIDDVDYFKARLKAVYYIQDVDNLWKEVTFADDNLSCFDITSDGKISYNGKLLEEFMQESTLQFIDTQEQIKFQREQEELRRAEMEKQRLEEENRRREEMARLEQERRLGKERVEKAAKEAHELFLKNLAINLEQQETPVRDASGKRWIKCKYCGKISTEKDFPSFGGKGSVNLGICNDCYDNSFEIKDNVNYESKIKVVFNPNICPECGSKLVERKGYRGLFIGCSGFPQCRYTRNSKK